jgi:hypothetical protein
VLTIKQKLDLISKLDKGSSIKQFSLKYEVYKTTVHDIRNNRQAAQIQQVITEKEKKQCIQKKTLVKFYWICSASK